MQLSPSDLTVDETFACTEVWVNFLRVIFCFCFFVNLLPPHFDLQIFASVGPVAQGGPVQD